MFMGRMNRSFTHRETDHYKIIPGEYCEGKCGHMAATALIVQGNSQQNLKHLIYSEVVFLNRIYCYDSYCPVQRPRRCRVDLTILGLLFKSDLKIMKVPELDVKVKTTCEGR